MLCRDEALNVCYDKSELMLCREETQVEAVMAEAEAAPPFARENATMELVNYQLQQADPRFWELEENDLSVCLRSDGTDWQLGSGAFGTVC